MKKQLVRIAIFFVCVAMAVNLTAVAQELREPGDGDPAISQGDGGGEELPAEPREPEEPQEPEQPREPEEPGEPQNPQEPEPPESPEPEPPDRDSDGENGEEPGGGQEPENPGDGEPPVEGDGDGEEPDEENGEPGEGVGEDSGEEPEPDLEAMADLAPATIEYRGVEYLLFEITDTAGFQAALTTAYTGDIRSVYLRLQENINAGGALSPIDASIERVAVDGAGEYTLTEDGIIRASASLREIHLFDLTIVGKNAEGLFHAADSYSPTFYYSDVTYSGKQLNHARGAAVYITNLNATISEQEVAEAKSITLAGEIEVVHRSEHSVFWNHYGGNLTLAAGARVNVRVEHDYNHYIVHPEEFPSNPSRLILEENASFVIRGNPQRFTRDHYLGGIELAEGAVIDWETDKNYGVDLVSIAQVNPIEATDPSIHLAPGARMRVASTGTLSGQSLINVRTGMVVLESGAALELYASNYTAGAAYSPLLLSGGGMEIGVDGGARAVFSADIHNTQRLTFGLVRLEQSSAVFAVGPDGVASLRGNDFGSAVIYFDRSNAAFTVDRGGVAVIRASSVNALNGGAVGLVGSNSQIRITDPDYIEIETADSRPFALYGGGAFTFANIGQVNHWQGGSATRLDDGEPLRRWLALDGEGFDASATVTAPNSFGAVTLTGELDPDWLTGPDGFAWNSTRLFSMGRVEIEVGEDDITYGGVEGRLARPRFTGAGLDELGAGAARMLRKTGAGWESLSDVGAARPDFSLRAHTEFDELDSLWVEAEYRYVFDRLAITLPGPPLSLTVPERLRFEDVTIRPADQNVPARETHALQVVDRRPAGSEDWKIFASFSGFEGEGRVLVTDLLLNQFALSGGGQRIAADSGSKRIELDAALFVPGGAGRVGAYSGVITWVITDAP